MKIASRSFHIKAGAFLWIAFALAVVCVPNLSSANSAGELMFQLESAKADSMGERGSWVSETQAETKAAHAELPRGEGTSSTFSNRVDAKPGLESSRQQYAQKSEKKKAKAKKKRKKKKQGRQEASGSSPSYSTDEGPPAPIPEPPAAVSSKFSKASSRGKAGCPPGTFLDIGRGDCWSCPSGYNRTIFPVNKPNACERPASTRHSRATHHGRGTGLLGTDCARGQFWDFNGNCYSCPAGYNRSAYAVTDARACSQLVPATFTSATQGKDFCASGSFLDVGRGECWACPSGWHRTINAVNGDKACASEIAGIFEADGAAVCKQVIRALNGGGAAVEQLMDDLAPILEPVLGPLESTFHELEKTVGVPAELDAMVDRAAEGLRPHLDSLSEIERFASQIEARTEALKNLLLDSTLLCDASGPEEIEARLRSIGLSPKRARRDQHWLDELFIKSAHAGTTQGYTSIYVTFIVRNTLPTALRYVPDVVLGVVFLTNSQGEGGVYFAFGGHKTTKKDKFVKAGEGRIASLIELAPTVGFYHFPQSALGDFGVLGSASARVHFGSPKRFRRVYEGPLGLFSGLLLPTTFNLSFNPTQLKIPGWGFGWPVRPVHPPAPDPRNWKQDLNLSVSFVGLWRMVPWR